MVRCVLRPTIIPKNCILDKIITPYAHTSFPKGGLKFMNELDEMLACVNLINKKLTYLCKDNKNIELLYEFDNIFMRSDDINRLKSMRLFVNKLNILTEDK